MKTYREIISKIGNREFTIDLEQFNSKDIGLKITADCWTDDPEVLEWPATFSITTNWGDGQIGKFDNLRNELDIPLMKLADTISEAVGGSWSYVAADQCFVQTSR